MSVSGRWRAVLSGAAILMVVLAVPLVFRLALATWRPREADTSPSYLPVLEAERPREPFLADPIGDLRAMDPGYVIVGDSMAGRIDWDMLTSVSGRPVAPVVQNATGSAYWYLVLKNYVVASGIRPKLVIVFFRDTNLTDVTFRLEGPYRAALDQVAQDREPELNDVVGRRTRGGWRAVHEAIDRAYDVDRAREWIEPALTSWPARVVAAPGRSEALLSRANAAFTLDKLRHTAQADVDAADLREADFGAHVQASVLPLMLDLAGQHHLRLCFVRVLRRPVNGAPPPESPQLQAYARELGAYIRGHGAIFIDDRQDPALAKLEYADGDHVSRDARAPYTTRFWSKIRALMPLGPMAGEDEAR